jgi:superfamily II DNA/RNA helicase
VLVAVNLTNLPSLCVSCRVGRTGRGGRKGTAITYFTPSDEQYAPAVVEVLASVQTAPPPWLADMVEKVGVTVVHSALLVDPSF